MTRRKSEVTHDDLKRKRKTDVIFSGCIRRRARAPAAGGGLGGWLIGLFTPRAFALTAGAAVVVMMLQAGVIAKLVLQDRGEARSSFETADTSRRDARA